MAPSNDADIQQLLTNDPTSPAYAAALQRLIQRAGLYKTGALDTRLALTVDRSPELSVAGRKATVFFHGTRELGDYVASGVPGVWDIERHGSQLRLCVAQPAATTTRWRIDLYVAGATILAAQPTPDDLQRVVAVPSLGDAQTPIVVPEVGDGNVRHLDWALAPAPAAKARQKCRGAAAYGIPPAGNPVVVDIALPTATRALLNAFAGGWSHVRLALSYLTTTLVFVAIAILLLTPAGRRLDRELRRRMLLAVAAWFVLLCGAAATWLLAGSGNTLTATERHPGLVAAGGAVLLAAAAVSRRWLLIAIAPVVALTAGGYAAQAHLSEPYLRDGWGAIALAALPAFATAAMALVALAVLGGTLFDRYTHRLALAGLVVAVLVVAQAAGAGYAYWHDRHQATLALNSGQFVFPRAWVAGYLGDFVFSFIGFVTDLLPVLAFAMVVSALRSLGAKATSPLIRNAAEAVPAFAGILFVAYVVGIGGLLYGWKVPAAFLVATALAFAVWRVIRHPRAASVADAAAELNEVEDGAVLIVAQRQELLQRAVDVVELRRRLAAIDDDKDHTKHKELEAQIHELEIGGVATAPTRLPDGASPGSVALRLGPGDTWWENARIAARWGMLLAIAPLLFFAYVLLTQRLVHDLSPWHTLGIADVIRSSLNEVLFWLSAALVLGLLFPYLPTAWGAVKGATLATVYTAAVGLSVWIVPGAGQGWGFRAFELFLFLIALGVLLDWQTLQRGRAPNWYLGDIYRIGDVRYVGGYASAAVASVALIAQQLQTGQGQAAITSIVKSIPVLIPPVH